MNTTEVRGIKCAHCKQYHPTIPDVKACAASYNAAGVFSEKPPALSPADLAPAAPDRSQAKRDAVPEGKYAVYRSNVLGFFKVDKPTEGKWAGFTFVNQIVSEEEYKLSREQANRVLDLIAPNPFEASVRYGRELRYCGVCGRKLTKKESREAGIGPVCRERMGW